MEKSCKIFGDGTNMADWQENFSSLDLGEDETELAIRLAEALRTDEVETFLEIYDSIPSTTETKRVSILITTLLFLFLKSSARLEKLKFMRTRLSCFFLRIRVFALWKKKETVHSLQKMVLSFGEFAFVTRLPCEQPEQIFLSLCFCRKMLSDLVSKYSSWSVGTHSVDRLPGGKIYAILDMWPSFGWILCNPSNTYSVSTFPNLETWTQRSHKVLYARPTSLISCIGNVPSSPVNIRLQPC